MNRSSYRREGASDPSALLDLIATLGDHSVDGVLISEASTDAPGEARIVWCNPGFEAMTGYALEEIVGRTPAFLRGPGTDMTTVQRIIARRHANLPVREELLNYRKNGEPFWVDISMPAAPPANGPFRLIVAIQRDITAMKRREEALRQALDADSLLAAVVENVGAEIQIFDAETLAYVRVNGAARRALDRSSAEFRTMTPVDVIIDWDQDRLRAAIAPLIAHETPHLRLRYRQRRKDGSQYSCTADVTYLRRAGRGLIVAIVADQTERETAQRMLALSERRYQMAVEASADGIFDIDLVDRSVVYSARNREMLGYDAEEFPNCIESWRRYVHPDDRPAVTARMDAHIEQDSGFDVTYRMRHKNGDWRWWRSRAAVWRDGEGRARRVIGTNSDVTELVRAREVAEEAARLKADFLAKMSHEIRTPLNGILGMTELMRLVESDPLRLERLRTISSSGLSLLTIIEDVLTLARLDAGVDPSRLVRFDLPRLCESALDPVRVAAQAKGLKLAVAAEPACFVADERRIRQVLMNLVGNAVKFTDAGGVTIRAYADGARLRFAVADTGPGVPEHLRENIFEPFRQGDDSITCNHGGLGLGLAIAREFVRVMGGEIGLTVGPDRGTTFWFDAPLAASDQPAAD